MPDDDILEELKRLGVPLNEEEELRSLREDAIPNEELEKELELLLNKPAETEEVREADVEDLNKMLSQISLDPLPTVSLVPETSTSMANHLETSLDITNHWEARLPAQQKAVPSFEDVTREQIKKCEQAFEYYKSKANKEKAILFGRRQKALEEDLKNIQCLQKQITKCQVQYEVAAPVNDALKDDELEVTCDGLKPGQRLGLVLEFYSDVQAKQLTSNMSNMSQNNGKRCLLNVKRSDLRTAKFFEHRRIRIHLMEEYSYWFIFTAFKTVDKQSLKLDALLRNNETQSKVDFKNGQQSITITLRLRRPIHSTSGSVKVREVWQVASNGSSRGLYPELPVQELYLLPIEEVKSYNGLEYEISLLQNLKDTPQYDPDRLMLLETQRDMMSLQVQLGRITPEEYKQQLETERDILKGKAVREKRKPVARAYLKHMKLIEEEMKEMMM